MLDEPTVGLDPVLRATCGRRSTARRRRPTLLVSSHVMDEADALRPTSLLMRDGRLIAERHRRTLRAGPARDDLEEAFLRSSSRRRPR